MRALGLAALAFALAGGAQAQAPTGVTVYPPAFFAEARPATALDMIERLPGFSFDEGDEDVRGYSGAVGNVLIDGQRPASKRDGLDEVLARIPAAAVERIELIRGGAPGVDMGGRQVLANVVRKSEASAEGLVEAGMALNPDTVLPSLRLEGSRRRDGRFAEAALRLAEELDDEGGTGFRRRYGPSGALFRDAAVDERTRTRIGELKGGYEQPLAGGGLRASVSLLSEQARSRFTETAAETVQGREDTLSGEAGLRFERPLGERMKLDLVAIQQLGRLDSEEEDGSERFTEDSTSGESILRAAVRITRSESLSWEAGAEAAFNFLESRAALEEDGVPQALQGADVRVEERRAEAFAAATWKPAPALSLEAALRFEVSQIAQSGDIALERRFTYPKPRLAAAWSLSDSQQVRLRIERTVGQLDFGDFVASASLDEGAVSAGAADLEPTKAWVFEAAWERRFLEDGALVLTVRHEALTDVIDRVLFTGPGFALDAPDNIGDGRRDSLEATLTLPLGGIGLLTANAAWRNTEVADPTTGETRRISGEEPFTGEVAFTQDLKRWNANWGVEVGLAEREPEFRFDEVRLEREAAWYSAFVEMRPARAWRVKVKAENISGRSVGLRREVFDGPRESSPLDFIEERGTDFDPYVEIEVRRAFE